MELFIPKIKHETLRIEFKAGGLNNVDVRFKFVSLQCSWVKNYMMIVLINGR